MASREEIARDILIAALQSKNVQVALSGDQDVHARKLGEAYAILLQKVSAAIDDLS